jgi:hypothetical protein
MKRSTLLFFIGFGILGLHVLPHLQAVVPPPDGGYPGNNTAEGTDALLSLITGTDNTAMGFQALANNTDGDNNTAAGVRALFQTPTA